jgi:hypothetical protein
MKKKKTLPDHDGLDLAWVKLIASDEERGKTSDYDEKLRDLFFEYRSQGLGPNESWKKAKQVLSSFKF